MRESQINNKNETGRCKKVRDVIQKDSAWNIMFMWDDNINMITKEAECEDVD